MRRSLFQLLQNIGPDASNFVSCSECRTKNLCFSEWILESIWSILLYEINYAYECLNTHLQHHKLHFCHGKYISSNVGSRISQTVVGVGGSQPQGWGKTYYLARVLPKTAWKWKNLDRAGICSIPLKWAMRIFFCILWTFQQQLLSSGGSRISKRWEPIPKGRRQPIILAISSRKLHEIKKNGLGTSLAPHLHPPLIRLKMQACCRISVMFLHVSVIHPRGGGGVLHQGGSASGPLATTGYGQWVGGTHPVEMHSCYFVYGR